ncbi:MAG: hypothetical protein C5B50_06285 [Verrucomicrobia bacterium]|nr:MAG: hypothetical protein C5B50_06285 [Verrucomicrobiota bacterium]
MVFNLPAVKFSCTHFSVPKIFCQLFLQPQSFPIFVSFVCFCSMPLWLRLGPASARQARANSLTRRHRLVTDRADISIFSGFIVL